MNINNPTTFSAPDLTYTTANSSGSAGALRADDSVAIFSTTAPVAISTSTVSSATGDNPFASREDHVHGSTAIAGAASVAEMEAASSTSVWASPGRTQNHPGVCKAWCRLQGDGTLDGNYNVASITTNGTGYFVVVVDTDFSSVNYCQVVSATTTSCRQDGSAPAVGSSGVWHTLDDDNNHTEADRIWWAAFGDQ